MTTVADVPRYIAFRGAKLGEAHKFAVPVRCTSLESMGMIGLANEFTVRKPKNNREAAAIMRSLMAIKKKLEEFGATDVTLTNDVYAFARSLK